MPTCPDPDVAMEETKHTTSYGGDGIRTKSGGGILDALDLTGSYRTSYVCPDCGLVRFYAE